MTLCSTTLRSLACLSLALVCLASEADAQSRPSIRSRPAARTNYTNSSRSYITKIVIHKAEGSNAAGWFANPAARASAHYDVHTDGTIYQSVQDEDIAWHAGNSAVNRTSIGIEHAGYSARNDITDAEYRSSARLVAYLCARYRIPMDRTHIIAHAEVPHPRIPGRFGGSNAHWDPGSHWNWNYYMGLVRHYAGMGGAPTTPPGTSIHPTLRQGARGNAVVDLQNKLRAKGFNPGPSDGSFGPATSAAVRSFQAANGLTVDGVVGPVTWRKLNATGSPAPPISVNPTPTPTPAPAANPTLRQGARGPAVRTLQQRLQAHGFSPGVIDGVFGAQTANAVRRFQAARGLTVDALVGPVTWGRLNQSPPAAAAPAPTPSLPSVVLRQGSRGPAVRQLQDALRRKGFDPGRTDGDFGPRTARTVMNFQRSRGLVADAIVGPATWGALR